MIICTMLNILASDVTSNECIDTGKKSDTSEHIKEWYKSSVSLRYIELTVHTSCYCISDLLCVNGNLLEQF